MLRDARFAKHLLSKPGASALWRVLEGLENTVRAALALWRVLEGLEKTGLLPHTC